MVCKTCGYNHPLRLTCAQYFDSLGPSKIDPSTVAFELVANKSRSKDRHKDKDARRIYQRELMRKRRAAQ